MKTLKFEDKATISKIQAKFCDSSCIQNILKKLEDTKRLVSDLANQISYLEDEATTTLMTTSEVNRDYQIITSNEKKMNSIAKELSLVISDIKKMNPKHY